MLKLRDVGLNQHKLASIYTVQYVPMFLMILKELIASKYFLFNVKIYSHTFCLKCIVKWNKISKKCPTCR